jgi:tRNA A37 methylthiotransferase MiaB
MSLAAYGRQERPGRDTYRIWDLHFHTVAGAVREIAALEPDLVGISSLNVAHEQVGALVQALRASGCGARVIMGGPYATSYPDQCLSLPGVDAVVRNEGELPFLGILESLDAGRPLGDVPGVSTLRAGQRVDVPAPAAVKALDTLPIPAYDLVDLARYRWNLSQASRHCLPPHLYAPLFTSRSCPYGCTYCHSIFGKGFRAHSAERIFETVQQLYETAGVTNFHVLDDIFNLDRKRLLRFCELMTGSPIPARLYFVNGLRADLLDREQIEALAAAGTVLASVGVETASPRLQRALKKRVDVARVLRSVEIGESLGIFMNGFFMVGFPGETPAELEATFEAARLSRLQHAFFFSVAPSRGTEMGEALAAQGLEISPALTPDYIGLPPQRTLAAMPYPEFARRVRRGIRRFWSPWRVSSLLAHYPSLDSALVFLSDGRGLRLNANYVYHRLLGRSPLFEIPVTAPAEPSPLRAALTRRFAATTRGVARWLKEALPAPAGHGALPPQARGYTRQRQSAS